MRRLASRLSIDDLGIVRARSLPGRTVKKTDQTEKSTRQTRTEPTWSVFGLPGRVWLVKPNIRVGFELWVEKTKTRTEYPYPIKTQKSLTLTPLPFSVRRSHLSTSLLCALSLSLFSSYMNPILVGY